jgi:hypothetical protein
MPAAANIYTSLFQNLENSVTTEEVVDDLPERNAGKLPSVFSACSISVSVGEILCKLRSVKLTSIN